MNDTNKCHHIDSVCLTQITDELVTKLEEIWYLWSHHSDFCALVSHHTQIVALLFIFAPEPATGSQSA